MSTPSPPQLPPRLIHDFVIAFEGDALGYIICGIYVAVAITNLVLLGKKKNNALFAFTFLQLVVTTLYNAIQLCILPQRFPARFRLAGQTFMSILAPWQNVFIDVAYVVNVWTSDSFLVYRCYVVLLGYRRALALPVLLYAAVVGSSIAYLRFDFDPTTSPRAVEVATLCYWSSTIALNIITPPIIAVRFWWFRRQILRVSPQHARFHRAYMALTIESALLYMVVGMTALVVLAMQSTLTPMFFTALGPVQVLAPALIVNRIARGISVEPDFDSSGAISTIRYATPQQGRSTHEELSLGTVTQGSSESGAKLKQNGDTTSYSDNASRPIV